MTTTTSAPPFASPADTSRHGEYRVPAVPGDDRPLLHRTGRVVAPGTAAADTPTGAVEAAPGRFHLYGGWFCPWSHRSTLVVAVAGLQDVLPVSYVHGERDARGWAFREPTGPDPVHGRTLLREAYEDGEPGFDGHVSVPALYDLRAGRVHSNDVTTLDADLAVAFGPWTAPGVDLLPAGRADAVEALEARFRAVLDADQDPDEVDALLRELDARLRYSLFVLGDVPTLADLRLYARLVRWDVGANAGRRLGPSVPDLPHLWSWARSVHQDPRVRSVTDLSSFVAAGAQVPAWDLPHERGSLPGAPADGATPSPFAAEGGAR